MTSSLEALPGRTFFYSARSLPHFLTFAIPVRSPTPEVTEEKAAAAASPKKESKPEAADSEKTKTPEKTAHPEAEAAKTDKEKPDEEESEVRTRPVASS